MKGIRDWLFGQMLSTKSSLASDSGGDPAHAEASLLPPSTSYSSDNNQVNQPDPSLQQVVDYSCWSNHDDDEKKKDPLAKVEDLRVKFFRLLLRLGLSQDNVLVAKVLYRVHLASVIRATDSGVKRVSNHRARALAAEQEASGIPELNFYVRILVLGKTGVGKSATINSIFDQTKAVTNAFEPATDCIQEVVGTVNGIKVVFIDTPGFLPSSTSNVRRNRQIMLSVRRFIRKSPPDIVLFFERLDFINLGYSDFPLLKLMTEVFGTALWFNTTLVMTHASSALHEGPGGHPVNYESHVTQCTDLMQHYVHQVVSDSKLENPVLLVENHPQCKKNSMGEAILPNGQVWRSQFLLLCLCTRVLGDVSGLLKFQDSIELGPLVTPRVPSLPHLLSSLLQHRSLSAPSGVNNDMDEIIFSDSDEEDEYDQLPPIRILTKSQFKKLNKAQKKDYLEELEYRETLYLKKQLKEEFRKKQKKLSGEEGVRENDNSDDHQEAPDAILLPDMAVPLSFDSDCPVHRYRCVVTSDKWLVRPVLDPQGWDRDVGFDGINLETATEINANVSASIMGQMRKDKQDFSIQSECAAAYVDPRGPIYCASLDIHSAGKDLIYIIHGNTKLRNLKHNVTDCGVSLTSFGKKHYVGAKLEDTIIVQKRLKFVLNAGQIRASGQVAYGGSFEATLRGKDYPVRNDNICLSMAALTINKEMMLVGGFQSEFRPSRGIKVAVNANLNNQKMGQVSFKMSSSEHTEIALIAIFTIFRALFHRKTTEN
uniref:AIG1-type G domain-containing protein n=1 Tax=Rhizophora mucronata TaxID=61149 RepID=A0A2P2K9C8_RHIMU